MDEEDRLKFEHSMARMAKFDAVLGWVFLPIQFAVLALGVFRAMPVVFAVFDHRYQAAWHRVGGLWFLVPAAPFLVVKLLQRRVRQNSAARAEFLEQLEQLEQQERDGPEGP